MKPETKDQIAEDTAEADGTVRYWYSQGDMPAAQANPVLKKGMCQALCMIWVAVRKAGADFHGLLTDEAAINPHAQTIMTAQSSVLGNAKATGADASAAYSRWMVEWGRLLGYTVRAGFIEGATSGLIAGAILNAPGFTIVGFQNDCGGHAMVAHFSGDNVDFFDPNAGEFSIPRTAFREWFASLFYFMGYQKSPTRFWAIAHIT